MNTFNSFLVQIKIGPSDASTDSIQKSWNNNGPRVARGFPLERAVRGNCDLRAEDGRRWSDVLQ